MLLNELPEMYRLLAVTDELVKKPSQAGMLANVEIPIEPPRKAVVLDSVFVEASCVYVRRVVSER